jgi:hypothetical protein
MTAHTAAGIQPITVICSSRHSSPVRMRPLRKKDNQGSKIAMSVMIWQMCADKSRKLQSVFGWAIEKLYSGNV